jgi:hypothetical protein
MAQRIKEMHLINTLEIDRINLASECCAYLTYVEGCFVQREIMATTPRMVSSIGSPLNHYQMNE